MNDYCVPKDEFEWRDILLKCGCSKEKLWEYPYSLHSQVWHNGTAVYPMSNMRRGGDLNRISMSSFLEKHRIDNPKTSYSYPYRSLEERLHSLEVKSALFDDILKRLTVLEKKADSERNGNSFMWALSKMKEGYRVRRAAWREDEFIELDQVEGIMQAEDNLPFDLKVASATASDWVLHEKP